MAIQAAPSLYIPFNVNTGALLDDGVRRQLEGRKHYVQANIAPRDVIDLKGVGAKTKHALLRQGVATIGEFATMSKALVPAGLVGAHAALAAAAIAP